MGYMVIRGEETKKVFIDEISVLLIEDPAISLTGCLLEALAQKKIRVIFCNAKRNPYAELQPYYDSYDCSRKLKMQLAWSEDIKANVWASIVGEKIRKQAELLRESGKDKEAQLLCSYICRIMPNDTTNREGHAAKVYFNALFGVEHTRTAENATNAALNYGYSIILSAFNREVTSNGYLTQLGIFHDNMFNHFNLSCDLMEPFRILIDRKVKNMELNGFNSADKHILLNTLNDTVVIDNTRQTVLNSIKYYCRSVFDALNEKDASLIRYYRL